MNRVSTYEPLAHGLSLLLNFSVCITIIRGVGIEVVLGYGNVPQASTLPIRHAHLGCEAIGVIGFTMSTLLT